MLKSVIVMPPDFLFSLRTALGTLKIYLFFLILMNFRVVLNLKATLGNIAILRTLFFLIHGHESFVHLIYVLFSIFHEDFVLFNVEGITSSIKFIPRYFFPSVVTVNQIVVMISLCNSSLMYR